MDQIAWVFHLNNDEKIIEFTENMDGVPVCLIPSIGDLVSVSISQQCANENNAGELILAGRPEAILTGIVSHREITCDTKLGITEVCFHVNVVKIA